MKQTIANSKLEGKIQSECKEDETVTIAFDAELPVGEAKLSIAFSGQLNDDLVGFYRCAHACEPFACSP
jgi:hypothetical protein